MKPVTPTFPAQLTQRTSDELRAVVARAFKAGQRERVSGSELAARIVQRGAQPPQHQLEISTKLVHARASLADSSTIEQERSVLNKEEQISGQALP